MKWQERRALRLRLGLQILRVNYRHSSCGGSCRSLTYSPRDGTISEPKRHLFPPPRSENSLSLTKKGKGRGGPLADVSNQRFRSPVKEKEFRTAAKGVVPTNTKQCNEWACRVYRSWVQQRNERGNCTEKVPENLLGSDNPELVCKFMCYFVLEVRQENGEEYTPGTLRCLLSGINRTMKDRGATFSILNKNDPAFRELMLTLDSITSNLHRCGIGATRNNAPVISIDHEHMFWEKGLLGFDDPKALQRAAFFCIGLHFVLRGVEEQHHLKRKQLVRHPADFDVYSGNVYYEYTEYVSKNNQH